MEPKIVYKYRDWGKPSHQRYVNNTIKLYLSSPKDFNDPLIAELTTFYSTISKEEEIISQTSNNTIS